MKLSKRIKTLKILQQKFSDYKKDSFCSKDLQYFTKERTIPPDFKNQELIFGKLNTDHMLRVDYFEKKGWDIPKIIPFQNLSIHPFNSTIHYAFSCFEGMKAYKDKNGNIRLFRPLQNMKRFLSSCNRLTFPSFNPDELLELVSKYSVLEKNWIPETGKGSLYLRPLAISMADFLGVEKPNNCSLFVMGCPVGGYFKGDNIKLIVDETYLRGHPKNAAGFKISSNYGPTVKLSSQVENKGFLQTIWTHNENLIESGASNIFFVLKNKNGIEVVTHPIDGSILPGITRDSIIKLTNDKFDFEVTERNFSINEFIKKHKSGELVEVFMSGTAAVISQVNMIRLRNNDYHFEMNNNNNLYSTTMADYINKIQFGEIDHPFSLVIG